MLKAILQAEKSFGRKGAQARNDVIARHTLHTELEHFDDPQTIYGLDRDTVDRLLAHARQDAAFALLNTITIMSRQKMFIWASLILQVLTLIAVSK